MCVYCGTIINMIIKRIIKHGNSLAVVLPCEWCRGLSLNRGDHVAMVVSTDQAIVIKKLKGELVPRFHNQIKNG